VLAVIGWYAVSPLLMPGFLWLTTSVHLMTSQIFVILAVDLSVRYTVTGRLRLAVGFAACLLGAVAFWEMTAVTALLLPIISLGFLHSGTPWERVRALLRRWPGWLVLGGVLGCWLAAFLSGPYGASARSLSAGEALRILRVGWLDSIGPALIGGPWNWFAYGDIYFSVSDPPNGLVVGAQFAAAVVLILGWRRSGWRSLVAWTLPAVSFVLGMLLVAVGRAWVYGDLTPKTFNYLYVLAVPIAIAAALALLPSTPDAIRERANGVARLAPTPVLPHFRPASVAVLAAAVLVFVSSAVSAVTFSNRWARNPSRAYVSALTASVRAAGPNVNLWDTRVPDSVLAALSSGNHLSDVLALAGVPAKFDDPATDPMLVRDDGVLTPAAIFPVARGVQRPHTACTKLVQHRGSWTVPFSAAVGENEYFVKISYLQEQPSVVYLSFRDATSGREVAPVTGTRTQLDGQLANVYLRLPLAAPRTLVIRSQSLDTNLCIGAVVIGVPVPTAAR
jgi:hypothetical protein